MSSLDPDYFLEIAHLIKKGSTCTRTKVGALIIRDNRIISSGFNGAPENQERCTNPCARSRAASEVGQNMNICRGVHAECNAILQCAYIGVSCRGAIMFSTLCPCIECTKLIINSGIVQVYYGEEYHHEPTKELQKKSGIEFVRVPFWDASKRKIFDFIDNEFLNGGCIS